MLDLEMTNQIVDGQKIIWQVENWLMISVTSQAKVQTHVRCEDLLLFFVLW